MTDREKLIELLDKSFRKAEEDCGAVACGDCDAYGVDKDLCMLTLVANMLIANGVVVREKGEWLKTREPLGWQEVDVVECSLCHESWLSDEDDSFDFLTIWHFCPNCGADMRQGENDGA